MLKQHLTTFVSDSPFCFADGDEASTPVGQRFNYLFYVDFVGTLAEVRCQNALRHLQEIAPMLRVLGTYPMDVAGATSSDDSFRR